jgi:hypothetical protein
MTIQPIRRVLAGLLTFALLLASSSAVAAGAAAGWGGSVVVSGALNPDPTRGSQLIDMAGNANGVIVAAWEQYSYAGAGSSSIGVAVQTAGRWSAPATISSATASAFVPSVAVGADGTSAVSWTSQTSALTPPATATIQVAVRRPGASAWTVYSLDQEPMTGAQTTEAAPLGIDSSGDVTVAWTFWDGTHNAIKAAALMHGATVWTAKQVVSSNVDASSPSLAVNAAGDAAIVYLGTTTTNPMAVAQLVSRTGATGSWTTVPATVSETIDWSVGYVQLPKVVLDSAGHPTVMYRALGSGIEVNRPQPDGSWLPQGTMVIPSTVPGASLLSPDVAVDDTGNVYVVVSIFDPTINVDRASVWTNVWTGGHWTGPTRLTDPTVPVDAYATRVSASTDGRLVMVGWIDHYHGVVQESAWSGSAWGKPTTIGKGAAWAAFQDQMRLSVGSSTKATAIWKRSSSSKGLQILAASYR